MELGNGKSVSVTSAYGTPTALEVPASIGNELQHVEQCGVQLHTMIDQLAVRLEAILRPMPPAGGGCDSAKQAGPPVSKVVQMLRSQGYVMDGAIVRLQDLIDRLEL